MAVTAWSLPVATRNHLFNLVTDKAYRDGQKNSSYDYGPGTDGGIATPLSNGNSLKKWGWEEGWPSGTADRNGGHDPGAYRLARFIEQRALTAVSTVKGYKHTIPEKRTSWWKLTHPGVGNGYRCDRIVIPACPTCKGTSETICGTCHGTGAIAAGRGTVGGVCPACQGKVVLKCTKCVPLLVIDGRSIRSDKVESWKV